MQFCDTAIQQITNLRYDAKRVTGFNRAVLSWSGCSPFQALLTNLGKPLNSSGSALARQFLYHLIPCNSQPTLRHYGRSPRGKAEIPVGGVTVQNENLSANNG